MLSHLRISLCVTGKPLKLPTGSPMGSWFPLKTPKANPRPGALGSLCAGRPPRVVSWNAICWTPAQWCSIKGGRGRGRGRSGGGEGEREGKESEGEGRGRNGGGEGEQGGRGRSRGWGGGEGGEEERENVPVEDKRGREKEGLGREGREEAEDRKGEGREARQALPLTQGLWAMEPFWRSICSLHIRPSHSTSGNIP